MTTALDIIDGLQRCKDRSWWPIPADRGSDAIILNAVLIVLSGKLDDIDPRNENQLKEAALHGDLLVSSRTISVKRVKDEADRIDGALARWGRFYDRYGRTNDDDA